MARALASHRRVLSDRRGATAIEFALLSPALFLTLYGCMEFGRMVWTQSSLDFAVQQAARCAAVTPSVCGTASQITSYAASQLSMTYIPTSAFSATTASCGSQVKASYVFVFVARGLFSAGPTLTASACFP